MDIRWLQDFLTVAETGNFTRAADERNASQAAFSRRIQSLEAWLGVTLIDRSVFPTRLTSEGELFRDQAAQILQSLLDSRAELTDKPRLRRDQVKVALPHALAIGKLPFWWRKWSVDRSLQCQVVPGNVHDTVTSFVSGAADLLVCFHHAQQPIHLDAERFERIVVGQEVLKPYAAASEVARLQLPGRAAAPLPLLMYSPGTYLGRMVDLIVQGAPQELIGNRVFDGDMADLLANMCSEGYGVAWLPGCSAAQKEGRVVALDHDRWSMKLSVVAYRDRTNTSPALRRLWAGIVSDVESIGLNETNSPVTTSGTKLTP